MSSIVITTVDGMEPSDLNAIRSRLTKPSSEFQAEVARVLTGEISSCTPIALHHRDGALIGWACSHAWRDMQTLEQFTDERHRRRGIAVALSAALVAHGVIDRRQPLAVFSDATAVIARRLGVADVRQYRRDGADWVQV